MKRSLVHIVRIGHVALLAATCAVATTGCRGQIFVEPPRHLIWDMDFQHKFLPQSENYFFADRRAMRLPVDGTVAQGELRDDVAFYRGLDPATGKPLTVPPMPVDERLVRRGQERFNIYCSPCHDKSGSGNGTVVQRGFYRPPGLTEAHVRTGLADGEIFDIISHGVRNMPAYGNQVPEQDRWAIVTWVRALGRSQHAGINDVPADKQGQIEQGAK